MIDLGNKHNMKHLVLLNTSIVDFPYEMKAKL